MINSAEEFVKLRKSNDPKEYQRAARESASLEVWKSIIENYPQMKEWVAYNKTVPQEILKILADDPNKEVRWMVAARRSAGEEILEKLSSDKDEGVRKEVLNNPKVTKKVLENLLYDNWEVIRISAKNKLDQMDKE